MSLPMQQPPSPRQFPTQPRVIPPPNSRLRSLPTPRPAQVVPRLASLQPSNLEASILSAVSASSSLSAPFVPTAMRSLTPREAAKHRGCSMQGWLVRRLEEGLWERSWFVLRQGWLQYHQGDDKSIHLTPKTRVMAFAVAAEARALSRSSLGDAACHAIEHPWGFAIDAGENHAYDHNQLTYFDTASPEALEAWLGAIGREIGRLCDLGGWAEIEASKIAVRSRAKAEAFVQCKGVFPLSLGPSPLKAKASIIVDGQDDDQAKQQPAPTFIPCDDSEGLLDEVTTTANGLHTSRRELFEVQSHREAFELQLAQKSAEIQQLRMDLETLRQRAEQAMESIRQQPMSHPARQALEATREGALRSDSSYAANPVDLLCEAVRVLQIWPEVKDWNRPTLSATLKEQAEVQPQEVFVEFFLTNLDFLKLSETQKDGIKATVQQKLSKTVGVDAAQVLVFLSDGSVCIQAFIPHSLGAGVEAVASALDEGATVRLVKEVAMEVQELPSIAAAKEYFNEPVTASIAHVYIVATPATIVASWRVSFGLSLKGLSLGFGVSHLEGLRRSITTALSLDLAGGRLEINAFKVNADHNASTRCTLRGLLSQHAATEAAVALEKEGSSLLRSMKLKGSIHGVQVSAEPLYQELFGLPTERLEVLWRTFQSSDSNCVGGLSFEQFTRAVEHVRFLLTNQDASQLDTTAAYQYAIANDSEPRLSLTIDRAKGLTGTGLSCRCVVVSLEGNVMATTETNAAPGDSDPVWFEVHQLEPIANTDQVLFLIMRGNQKEGGSCMDSAAFRPSGFDGWIPISGCADKDASLKVTIAPMGEKMDFAAFCAAFAAFQQGRFVQARNTSKRVCSSDCPLSKLATAAELTNSSANGDGGKVPPVTSAGDDTIKLVVTDTGNTTTLISSTPATPNQAFPVGSTIQTISKSTLREGEAMDSSKVTDLPPATIMKVTKVGSAFTGDAPGRRLGVLLLNNDNLQGWISCEASNGQAIVEMVELVDQDQPTTPKSRGRRNFSIFAGSSKVKDSKELKDGEDSKNASAVGAKPSGRSWIGKTKSKEPPIDSPRGKLVAPGVAVSPRSDSQDVSDATPPVTPRKSWMSFKKQGDPQSASPVVSPKQAIRYELSEEDVQKGWLCGGTDMIGAEVMANIAGEVVSAKVTAYLPEWTCGNEESLFRIVTAKGHEMDLNSADLAASLAPTPTTPQQEAEVSKKEGRKSFFSFGASKSAKPAAQPLLPPINFPKRTMMGKAVSMIASSPRASPMASPVASPTGSPSASPKVSISGSLTRFSDGHLSKLDTNETLTKVGAKLNEVVQQTSLLSHIGGVDLNEHVPPGFKMCDFPFHGTKVVLSATAAYQRFRVGEVVASSSNEPLLYKVFVKGESALVDLTAAELEMRIGLIEALKWMPDGKEDYLSREGSIYLGTRVKRIFTNDEAIATVVAWNPEEREFRLVHDDGDEEDVTKEELDEAVNNLNQACRTKAYTDANT